MNNKILLIIAAMLCFLSKTKAQDLHFSQFYENGMLRNPALTGIFSGDYKAGINYRQQWSSIAAPYRTMLASVETKIPVNEVGDFFSCGATIVYDRAGSTSFSSLQAYPAINYSKAIEDNHNSYLSVGATVGYLQRSVSSGKMIFGDQFTNGYYSPDNVSSENITNTKAQYFDVGTGISFNSSMGENNRINYYIGASAFHINRPKIAFNENDAYTRLPLRWNGNFGMQWMVEEHAILTLHANYSRQENNEEILAGFLASWRVLDEATQRKLFAVYGGCFYRFNDALIPTIKIDYKQYSFTVSYDINCSTLKKASNGRGGYEFSLFVKDFLHKGLWATDKTKCPRFEELMLPEY